MHCDIDYSHMIIIDTLHYAKIHKTITVLPPQSSGIVPLNDPVKTSVPANMDKPLSELYLGYYTVA